MSTDHHPAVTAFLDALCAADKGSTARTYGFNLLTFETWARGAGVDLMRATTDQLAGFQLFLAHDRMPRTGTARSRAYQASVIIVVQSFYSWMMRRNMIVHDPAAPLTPPSQPKNRMVRKDHLTLQESTALIQTQAAIAEEETGPKRRALESRNLAMLAMALATGRRVQGLVDLSLAQVDLDRREIRVEREKGHTGRVLPVAEWAMATVRRYLDEARPVLAGTGDNPSLFINGQGEQLCTRAVGFVLANAIAATIERNPDLTDLPNKRISTHSLRVSFATMLFAGGCNIRSINELMLHQSLSVTARYTPIAIADMRRSLLATHPRA